MTEQDSRAQQEAERAQGTQDPVSGTPRFGVKAIPGRRASYSRFEIIRATVIIIGLVAVVLFVGAEWLAIRHLPDTTASLRATSSILLSATIDPYTPIPSTMTPASSSAPTRTPSPTPTPTRTLVPTVTRRPKPTAVQATPTPAPLPAPDLVEPPEGATPLQRATFRWQWTGPPLAENQAFNLRIWSAQEEQAGVPKRGAVAPTQDLYTEVDLQYVPAVQDYGPGDYYWAVVVVKLVPDGSVQLISHWGESRRFVYH